ncbi:unnamed protein product [Auanema sp. JU1783]|nr:unnamed protein product [Auanema sp. JU1783]
MCRGLVEPATLSFDVIPQDVITDEGTELFMPCHIFSSPQGMVQWYHDDQLISEDRAATGELIGNQRVIGSGLIASQLRIPCVDERTAGNYRCEARTPCGQKISTSARVSVRKSKSGQTCGNKKSDNFAPYIKFATQSRIELAGNVVELTCKAGGHPAPTIIWTKYTNDDEEVPVRTFRREGEKQEILVVRSEFESASESFKCTARNEFGEATAEPTIIYVSDEEES